MDEAANARLLLVAEASERTEAEAVFLIRKGVDEVLDLDSDTPLGRLLDTVRRTRIQLAERYQEDTLNTQLKAYCRLFKDFEVEVVLFLTSHNTETGESKPLKTVVVYTHKGMERYHGKGVHMCEMCGKPAKDLPSCSACHRTYYCGPECQKQAWKKGRHRELCRAWCAFVSQQEE